MAREETAGDAFVLLCSAALEQIAANAPGVVRGDDPEYLHQLRVGIRRLLSVVRAFRPLLRRKRADAILRRWRDMMRILGRARDWDVLREMLADGEASTHIRSEHAAAQRAARALVRSPDFQAAHVRTVRWLEDGPWRSHAAPTGALVQFARRSLARLHGKLLERTRHIDWHDAARRHKVRIAVKRLRYAADFFSTCFPREAVRPFLVRLSALQDVLGELNDISVARQLLAEAGFLARRERELIASLAKEWDAFERRKPYWKPKPTPRARR